MRPGLARTATRAALGLALLAAAAGTPAARAGDEHGHDAGAEAAGSAAWQTPAERSGFQSTPSYDETIAFLRRLEARSPALRLGFYGNSGEGRPLPFVVVSREGAFTPQAAQAQDKPIVMIVAGIHAGEIDGKDALLMILRDIALGEASELLDAATLLVVPIYNVDGHERVSPFNRPNQDGPRQGMGFRTTASGLDLNRDHVKLESPEARALVGLFNAWRPHLHVDTHVTDGVDLEWTLTFVLAEAPRIAPYRDRMIANIAAAAVDTPEAVSVKATTTEACGAVGRGEGIGAMATVLLQAVPRSRDGGA